MIQRNINDDATLAYLFKKVWDAVYPVGSIYMSANSTSPERLFGGKWEPIEDRFLLAAGKTYGAGETGGKALYTAADMPAHSHTRGNMDIKGMIRCYSEYNKGNTSFDTSGVSGAFYFRTGTDTEYGTTTNMGSGNYDAIRNVLFSAARNWTGNTNTVGSSQNAEIIPPYLAVYVWKRTA